MSHGVPGEGALALEHDSAGDRPAVPPLTFETRPRVSLLPIFLIVLVDVFGMTLVLPLLAIYAETFHATPLQATLLVSTFAACQLVSGPLIGHWSDRLGRKPMLVISQVGTCIGFPPPAHALKCWIRERGLAAFKVPDRIVFVETFPVTAVGKTSRRELRVALREHWQAASPVAATVEES